MNDDARKLLGGYATGTLTSEERQALFAAALEDQELFDALAEEEALREQLADPVFREELQEAIEPERVLQVAAAAPPPRTSPWRWVWACSGAVGVAALALVTIWVKTRPDARSAPVTVAVERGPGPRVFQMPPAPTAPKTNRVPDVGPPPALRPQKQPQLPDLLAKSQVPAPVNRLKVAVFPFDSGREKPEVGQSMSQAVADTLQKDSSYSVIDPQKVQNAQQANQAPSSAEAAAKIGRDLGADAVVIGQVASSGSAGQLPGASSFTERAAAPAPPATVSAELVDSATGKTMRKAVAKKKSVQASAAALVQALEPQQGGKVTDVTAGILTLDIGSKAGARVGEQFRIVRGEETVGDLTVTSVGETFSVGRFTGKGLPQVGDRAVPIPR